MPMQLNLFPDDNRLPLMVAGLVAATKTALNRAAAASQLSRAQITDRANAIAQAAGVRLTQGNAKSVGADLVDKWLNPSEREHVPSLLAVNVLCLALGDPAPLAAMLQAHGCELMTAEDRQMRDYGRACAKARQVAKLKRKFEEELS